MSTTAVHSATKGANARSIFKSDAGREAMATWYERFAERLCWQPENLRGAIAHPERLAGLVLMKPSGLVRGPTFAPLWKVGLPMLNRAAEVFPNLREGVLLEGVKHVPPFTEAFRATWVPTVERFVRGIGGEQAQAVAA